MTESLVERPPSRPASRVEIWGERLLGFGLGRGQSAPASKPAAYLRRLTGPRGLAIIRR